MAVQAALNGAAEIGAGLDLDAYQLKYADITDPPPQGVLRLRKDFQQAHGDFLGTLEYRI